MRALWRRLLRRLHSAGLPRMRRIGGDRGSLAGSHPDCPAARLGPQDTGLAVAMTTPAPDDPSEGM